MARLFQQICSLILMFMFCAYLLLMCFVVPFLTVVAANQLLVLAGWGWDGFFTSDDPQPSWFEVAFPGVVLLSGSVMILWLPAIAIVRSMRSRLNRR